MMGMQDMDGRRGFKQCDVCGKMWPFRQEFLDDPTIRLIGYQVSFKELAGGLLLFNHACGTTLALKVRECGDLYDGPIFTERRTGEDDCPTYCLHPEELRACPAVCECAYVRELLQIILQWPKPTPQFATVQL